mmetsp:Transcript_26388/g.73784  ORF Transcript_26388/g.73784 Transcript_26388/m.73784 type:complete len:130 (-) Transcript_26388:2000-2389(-)
MTQRTAHVMMPTTTMMMMMRGNYRSCDWHTTINANRVASHLFKHTECAEPAHAQCSSSNDSTLALCARVNACVLSPSSIASDAAAPTMNGVVKRCNELGRSVSSPQRRLLGEKDGAVLFVIRLRQLSTN